MRRLAVSALVLMALGAVVPQALAQSDCDEASAFSISDFAVTTLKGSALKFSRPLEINMDGAPNAYHIDGRPAGALDTLCNAGRGISSIHGKYEGSAHCGQFLEDVKAAKQAGWHADPRIEWYGIATVDAAHNEPAVQTEGPFKGYFVSTTRLENTDFKVTDPRRYLDSRIVPFLVIPGKSAFFSQGKVSLGNVAFVYDPKSKRETFAIAGDLGPSQKLGEGSIALAAAIGGKAIDVATLTGKQAKALAIGHDIVTIIFPSITVQKPFDRAQVDAAAAAAADSFGGIEKLRACAGAR